MKQDSQALQTWQTSPFAPDLLPPPSCEPPPKRRRNRIKVSCLPCQKRKVGCHILDNEQKCVVCQKRGEDCTWPLPVMVGLVPHDVSKAFDLINARLATLESQMEASLESQVEASQLPTPHNSNNFNVGFPSPPPTSSLSDSETAVSETEAAAQALERIALGTCQYSPFLGLSARNSLCQTGAAQSWKIEPGAYTTIFASDPAVFSTCRPTWRDTLPEKVVCDCLINHFFDHLHFVFFVVHKPTFLMEYNQFWSSDFRNSTDRYIDPAWLAVFFGVLHAALFNINPTALPPLLCHLSNSLSELRHQCATTADACLAAASWEDRPSVRGVQAILLKIGLGPVAGRCSASSYFIYLASMTRLCQLLGFHRLGSNPEIMPKDDDGLPKERCTLKRELAKRLWWNCVFIDGIFASSEGMGLIRLGKDPDETDLLLNLNEDDLGLTMTHPSHPIYYVSDASYILALIDLAKIHHHANAISRRLPSTTIYPEVLSLHNDLQVVIDRIETGPLGRDARLPPYYKALVLSVLYNRVLRLHRPYFMRVYAESLDAAQYRQSFTASVLSAEGIANSLASLYTNTDNAHACHPPAFGVDSVLVLWVSLTQKARHGIDTSRERNMIEKMRDFYSTAEASEDRLQEGVAAQTCKIIDQLLSQTGSVADGNALRDAVSSLQHIHTSDVQYCGSGYYPALEEYLFSSGVGHDESNGNFKVWEEMTEGLGVSQWAQNFVD